MEGLNYQLEHPGIESAYYDINFQYRLGPGGYFVFGSNLAGRHGKGAALTAHEVYGARKGVGEGFTARTYAIPTKGHRLDILSLAEIKKSIDQFKWVCEAGCLDIDDRSWYYVTPIGTGLAQYKDEDIAPLFEGTSNCWFPSSWKPYLGERPGVYLERQ